MLVKLRIVFTILCAICLAAVIPLGTFLDWLFALPCLFCAGIFFVLMLLFKRAQEKKEASAAEPTPDFFSPSSENAKIDERNDNSR